MVRGTPISEPDRRKIGRDERGAAARARDRPRAGAAVSDEGRASRRGRARGRRADRAGGRSPRRRWPASPRRRTTALRQIMHSLVSHLHEFHHRGRADRGGVGGGDRGADRYRPHHRRQSPGVHLLVGHARRLDAGGRARSPGAPRGRPSRPCSARSTSPARRCASAAPTSPEQEAGTPAWVHGRVLDLDGNPIAGAELDIWQNGEQPPLRGPGPRRARRSPARRVPRPTPTGSFAFRRCARCPTRSRRRPGGADAGRDRAPSLAPGPHPHRRARPRPPER